MKALEGDAFRIKCFWAVLQICHVYVWILLADPDPTCTFDADPDPISHFDVDPNPPRLKGKPPQLWGKPRQLLGEPGGLLYECPQLQAVLRIHDILVWIRIRRSMPLANRDRSGSCYFCH